MDPDLERECKECPDMLNSEGIMDEKAFKKWSLKNHPDKFPGLSIEELMPKQEKFGKISSCVDTIYKSDKCKKNTAIIPVLPRQPVVETKITDLAIFSRPQVERKVSHIFGKPLSPFRSVSPPLFCPPNKIYRSGYIRSNGTRISPVCAKKKSKRRRTKKRSSKRRTKRRRCSKGKTRRRSYLRSSGKRVKSSCVKKPLKCSPRKTRRRSYTTKKGTHVKASCVRRRRRS
jgi:hypothetical protein